MEEGQQDSDVVKEKAISMAGIGMMMTITIETLTPKEGALHHLDADWEGP